MQHVENPSMHSTTFHLRASHCGVLGDDSPDLPLDVASEPTSQANGNLTVIKGTGAATGSGTSSTSPSASASGRAVSDDDSNSESSSSSDGEDSEVTAMKEEVIRYVNRGPPGPPSNSNGYSVPRKPRPPPQPTGGTSKPRPPAVTLGLGTTANQKQKPPKK